jgi:hypothetical protein
MINAWKKKFLFLCSKEKKLMHYIYPPLQPKGPRFELLF